jgi:hypothetical protein
MFKLIVAGSRDFDNFPFLEMKLNHLLTNVTDEIEIVSGGARGADKLGEQYAKKFNYKIKRFPARWKEFGRAAGPIRNGEMGDYAAPDGACVVFWKNRSNGSRNMICVAKNKNLKLRIYEV